MLNVVHTYINLTTHVFETRKKFVGCSFVLCNRCASFCCCCCYSVAAAALRSLPNSDFSFSFHFISTLHFPSYDNDAIYFDVCASSPFSLSVSVSIHRLHCTLPQSTDHCVNNKYVLNDKWISERKKKPIIPWLCIYAERVREIHQYGMIEWETVVCRATKTTKLREKSQY